MDMSETLRGSGGSMDAQRVTGTEGAMEAKFGQEGSGSGRVDQENNSGAPGNPSNPPTPLTLATLPDKLFVRIMDNLSTKDKLRLAQTHHGIYQRMWNAPPFDPNPDVFKAVSLHDLSKSLKDRATAFDKVKAQAFTDFLHAVKNILQELTLPSPFLTHAGADILLDFPNLKIKTFEIKLDDWRAVSYFAALISPKIPDIRTLTLLTNYPLYDRIDDDEINEARSALLADMFESLATSCPNIERLRFQWCTRGIGIGPQAERALLRLLPQLNNLYAIDLTHTKVSRNCVRAVLALPSIQASLRELGHGTLQSSADELAGLNHCRKLRFVQRIFACPPSNPPDQGWSGPNFSDTDTESDTETTNFDTDTDTESRIPRIPIPRVKKEYRDFENTDTDTESGHPIPIPIPIPRVATLGKNTDTETNTDTEISNPAPDISESFRGLSKLHHLHLSTLSGSANDLGLVELLGERTRSLTRLSLVFRRIDNGADNAVKRAICSNPRLQVLTLTDFYGELDDSSLTALGTLSDLRAIAVSSGALTGSFLRHLTPETHPDLRLIIIRDHNALDEASCSDCYQRFGGYAALVVYCRRPSDSFRFVSSLPLPALVSDWDRVDATVSMWCPSAACCVSQWW